MKMKSLSPLAGFGLWLVSSTAVLQASEPVHDLKDLAKLESKVESVSQKVMPATVALISRPDRVKARRATRGQ